MYYYDQLNEYFTILEKKFYAGKLGHKQFEKSLGKLDEWYEVFVENFGEEEDE
jgi:hypothetical protein